MMPFIRIVFSAILYIFISVGFIFAQPNLYIEKDAYNLGEIEANRIYDANIVLKNAGNTSLLLKEIYGTCGCIEVEAPKQKIIDPGEQLNIDFTFDSTGYIGQVKKYLYLYTNDPEKPFLKYPVIANVKKDTTQILASFRSLGPLTVIIAGLIDSVNPCAFTVLIFFVSFLTFVGYNRRELFLIGSLFILSVFITYLLLGLGLLEIFKKLLIFDLLSKILSYVVAIFAFFLGLLSIYDFWIYKKTKDPDKIKLKLPGMVKQQIQKVIRDTTDIRGKTGHKKKTLFGLIIASLLCGFLVTLLESVCTGQAYLPTIMFILKFGTMKLKAISYLLLYNFMFVFPLLVIMFVGITGDRSAIFTKLATKHLGSVKIITAGLFFVLGFVIIFADKIIGLVKVF